MEIVAAILTLGGLGLIFGGLLALAAQRFAVEEDPRVAQIEEALPGANCGACGYAGCANFAEAVAKGEAEPTGCIPGGKDTSQAICKILGKDAEGSESCRQVAEVGCIGDKETAKDRFQYDGVKDCRAAQMYNGGFKGCPYGCLGLGTCAAVCPFEAITMNEKGLPEIDEERCTGCGICVNECPRGVLRLKDADRKGHVVLCNSKDKAKIVRSVCDVGCIACKACERVCEKGAIKIIDNLAVIDPALCDDCGKCAEKCPRPVIVNLQLDAMREKEGEPAAAK